MYKIKKWLALMLAFVMAISCLNIAPIVWAEGSSETSGYKMTVAYNEDNSAAVIQGDASEVQNGVTISRITALDGTELDVQNPQYTVVDNGTYSFAIEYQKSVENTQDVQTNQQVLDVVVDRLIQKDTTNPESQPVSSQSTDSQQDGSEAVSPDEDSGDSSSSGSESHDSASSNSQATSDSSVVGDNSGDEDSSSPVADSTATSETVSSQPSEDNQEDEYVPAPLNVLLQEGKEVEKMLDAKAYEQETYMYLGDVQFKAGKISENIPDTSQYEFLKDKYKKEGAKLYLMHGDEGVKLPIAYITYIEFENDSEQNGYYYTLEEEKSENTYSQMAYKLYDEDTFEIQYPLKDRLKLQTVSVDWEKLPSDVEIRINGKLLKNENDQRTVQISQDSHVVIQLQHPNKYGVFEVYWKNGSAGQSIKAEQIGKDTQDSKTYWTRQRGFTMPANDVVITFNIQEWVRNVHKFALVDSTNDNNQFRAYKAGILRWAAVDGTYNPSGYSLPEYKNETWIRVDGTAPQEARIGESFNVISYYYNYNSSSGTDEHSVLIDKWNSQQASNNYTLNGSEVKKKQKDGSITTQWAAIGSYKGSSNLTLSYKAGYYCSYGLDKQLAYGPADYIQYSYWNNVGMLDSNYSNTASEPSTYTDFIPMYINGEKENAAPRSYTTSDGATVIVRRLSNTTEWYNLTSSTSTTPITMYNYEVKVIGATNDFMMETVSKNALQTTAAMDYDTTYIKDVSIGLYARGGSSPYRKHYSEMSEQEKKAFIEESQKANKPLFSEGPSGATNNDQVNIPGWYSVYKGLTYYNKWMKTDYDNKSKEQADPWLRVVVEEGYTAPGPYVYWSGSGVDGSFLPGQSNAASYLYFTFETTDHFKGDDGKNYVAYYYRMYSNGWPQPEDQSITIKFKSQPMTFSGDFFDTKGNPNSELNAQNYTLNGNLLTNGETANPMGILPVVIPKMYEKEYFVGWDFYLYPDAKSAQNDTTNAKAIGKIDTVYKNGEKFYYKNIYNQISEKVEKQGYQQLYIKAVPNVNRDGTAGYTNGVINVYLQQDAKVSTNTQESPIQQTGYEKTKQEQHQAMLGEKPKVAITQPTIEVDGKTYIANQSIVNNSSAVKPNPNGDTEITAIFYDQKISVEYILNDGKGEKRYSDSGVYTVGKDNHSKITLKGYNEIASAVNAEQTDEEKEFLGWKIKVDDSVIGTANGEYFTEKQTYDFASALNTAVESSKSDEFYQNVFDSQKIVFEAQYKLKDEPPILKVPEVLEFDVGDRFNPTDPEIIKGLEVSDKEDKELGLKDLKVTEQVPRQGKVLRLFANSDTDKLTTPGTYRVEYSITDSAENETTATLKVKVHGLPYFTSDNGLTYGQDRPVPTEYLRTKQTDLANYYYKNLKAYYLKAADEIGAEAIKTELPNSLSEKSQDGGSLAVSNFVNVKAPDVKVDNINEAGKYLITYKATTPRGTDATITRDIYVRGLPVVSANNIVISKNDKVKYPTWEEFLKVYGQEIAMKATVDVPNENGDVTKQTIGTFIITTPIQNIPFGDLQQGKTHEITFQAVDEAENYPTGKTEKIFMMTVEDLVGQAPKIIQPQDYDNQRVVGDKVMVNNQERTQNFVQALLDEADIYDVDESGKHYVGTPQEEGTETNETGKRYGISEKGIFSITQIDNGKNETIYLKSDNRDIEQTDTAIRTMYDTVGEYKVVYYAVDGDKNRIESTRDIKVASKTLFVEEVGYPNQDTPISVVNLRKATGTQTVTNVIAYHIDPNGGVHQQAALAQSEVKVDTVGLQKVQFTNTHHYGIIPGTNGQKRPADTATKTYLVHGNITFKGLVDKAYFVDENVDVMDGVSASFSKVNADGTVQETPAEVTAQELNTTFAQPKKMKVEYTATDNVTGVAAGKTAKGSRTITVVGLPSIQAQDTVKVKETATQEEIKQALNATASIQMPDQIISLTQDIQYDFSQAKDNKVVLSVSYTIDGGKSRTATKEVTIDYIKAPQIVALPKLEMSEQDAFNAKETTKVQVIPGDDTDVSLQDVIIKSEIPLQSGKISKPGTYSVHYSLQDKYGNTVSFETVVLADGLPTIEQKPLHERVGNVEALAAQIKATYMEAQEDGSLVRKNAKLKEVTAFNSEGKQVTIAEINRGIGKYQITYVESNGHGGTSTANLSMYVHGNITFEPIEQKMTFKTYPVNVLEGVKATFDRVQEDGTIVKENAVLSSNVNGNVVTSQQPGDVAVTYTAVDNITGVEAGKTATTQEVVRFADFPQITAPQTVSVQENETEETVLQLIKEKTTASINLVSETKDLTEEVTYAFMKDASATVVASVSYQIGEQTETATQQIKIRYAGAPAITGQAILGMNVGDAFDAIKTPDIQLVLGADEDLTLEDITIDSTLPMDKDGKITREGTYPITYSVTDRYGNTANHTVSVQVDSLPVLETTDLHGRIFAAPQLTEGARATYFEAQEKARPVKTDAQIWVTEIKDAQGNVVAQDALNKVGKYTVFYEAMNSNGAKTTGQSNLYLHGLIDVQTEVLEVTKTDTNQANQYGAQRLVQDGQIVATVPHTAQDGTIHIDSLNADSMEIVANTLDTSKTGQYVIGVKIRDNVNPEVETTAYVTVKVTEQAQDTTPAPNTTPAPTPQPTAIVVTGDAATLGGWLIVFMAATILLVFTTGKKRKK